MPCCRAQCCPIAGLQLPACLAAGPSAGLQLPACLCAALLKDSSSHHALLQGPVLPYGRTTAPIILCCRAQCCPMEGLQLPACLASGPSAALLLDYSSQQGPSAGLQLPACLCAALLKDYSSHHALLGMPCRAQCWTKLPACLCAVLYLPSCLAAGPQCCPMEGLQLPACLSAALWKDSSSQHALLQGPMLDYNSQHALHYSSHHALLHNQPPAPITPSASLRPPPPHCLHPGGKGKGRGGRGGRGGVLGRGSPPPPLCPPPAP